jgi:hypothetical protein
MFDFGASHEEWITEGLPVIHPRFVGSASDKPTYQDKSGIQIPNSLPGANRESSCRLGYVQY